MRTYSVGPRAHRMEWFRRVARSGQAMAEGKGRRPGPVLRLRLHEDVPDVDVHGPLAEREGVRDFPVALAAGDEAEHFYLALGEPRGICGCGRRACEACREAVGACERGGRAERRAQRA